MMLPALAWLAWQNVQPTPRDRIGALVGLALAASGFSAYCFYVYQLTGHSFEWAVTLQRWGYYPGGLPWTAPVNLVRHLVTQPYRYLTNNPMAVYDTMYVTAILFAGATPFGVAPLRWRVRRVHAPEPVAAVVFWVVRGDGAILLGALPVLHLAGIDPLALSIRSDNRRVCNVLHPGSRVLRDDSSLVLGAAGAGGAVGAGEART
jgi:hypothetical protein